MSERTTDRETLLWATGLREVDREGWKRVGIDRPESVAGHTFGVALACLLLAPPELDRGKLLAMALLHDLAEIDVGDLTPHDGVPREEKKRRESEAIERRLSHRPDLVALFHEAEAGESPEAAFLALADKLDMGAMAERYRALGYDTSEFLRSAEVATRRLLGGDEGV